MSKRRVPASAKSNKQLEANIEKFANEADKPEKEELTPKTDNHPLAPRKYKSITLPFNLYEFERIAEHCDKTRESKQGFIRQAILDALDK